MVIRIMESLEHLNGLPVEKEILDEVNEVEEDEDEVEDNDQEEEKLPEGVEPE